MKNNITHNSFNIFSRGDATHAFDEPHHLCSVGNFFRPIFDNLIQNLGFNVLLLKI